LDRTLELDRAHAALRQAQKMEAVGRLTGGIAHDFNNLLQSITGNLDLIRRKANDGDRVRRWSESGLKAAERGARLAAQLLAFSRTQKLDVAPIEISSAVTGFVETLERSLGPTIRIKTDLKTDGVYVEGDQVQLETAFLNLALNARDAMPDGGDLLIATKSRRLRGDGELPDGDYVELIMKDSGAGMSGDVIERAFEPFFTTKETGRGTGLGLSQVYGTMRQSGGAVRIESVLGIGTMVRLYLRRSEASPRDHDAHPIEPIQLSRATVLVVDDDPDVRAFLAESLDSLGYEPVIAEDGRAALKALERIAPHAMILDFAMPGMNGAEVAKRARERLPNLPIIFASGYSESAAVKSVQGKRSRVLRKPFKVDDLLAALIELLG
jgi:CheY-like chemotaxis protein